MIDLAKGYIKQCVFCDTDISPKDKDTMQWEYDYFPTKYAHKICYDEKLKERDV